MTEPLRPPVRIERQPSRRSLRLTEPPRPARRTITGPITAGSVVTLVADDGLPHTYLSIKTPSGLILLAPAAGGSYPLWVPEPGTYLYRWDDGEQRSIEVVEAPAPLINVVDPALLPPMSVLRRPRF